MDTNSHPAGLLPASLTAAVSVDVPETGAAAASSKRAKKPYPILKRRKSAKPLTYLRSRFYGKRANPIREPLKKGTGGINPCFKPSNEASKADLLEFHQEDLKLRRKHQLARQPNTSHAPSTSIAAGNRHGGAHQHKREIARRTA